MTYAACNYVSNICVHATADAKQPIAIIFPHENNLRHALRNKSIGVNENAHLSILCQNEKVKELVLKNCNAIGKKHGFKPMETLQGVILTPDEWTPESGLVTATQKIQRKKIANAFDKEIKVRLISGWSVLYIELILHRRRTRTNDDVFLF